MVTLHIMDKKSSIYRQSFAFYMLIACLSMLRFYISEISVQLNIVVSFVYLLLNLFYFFKVNQLKNLPSFFKVLNILLLLFTIHGILLILSDRTLLVKENSVLLTNKTAYLLAILRSLLPIYSIYFFASKNVITNKLVYFFFFIFLSLSLAEFYSVFLTKQQADSFAVIGETTNNTGYRFLSLFPFLYFFANKSKLQFILLLVISFLVVLAMKRGAILTLGLCIVYFIYFNYRTLNSFKRLLLVFVVLISCYFIASYFNELYISNSYFAYRLDKTLEGEIGERDIIYNDLIYYFTQKADLYQIIFGSGAWATLDVTINYAHQDWLELAVDLGLLGVIAYLFYWLVFLKSCMSLKHIEPAHSIMITIFVIYFMRTFFSMSYDNYEIYPCFCIGLALSRLSLARKKTKKDREIYVRG